MEDAARERERIKQAKRKQQRRPRPPKPRTNWRNDNRILRTASGISAVFLPVPPGAGANDDLGQHSIGPYVPHRKRSRSQSSTSRSLRSQSLGEPLLGSQIDHNPNRGKSYSVDSPIARTIHFEGAPNSTEDDGEVTVQGVPAGADVVSTPTSADGQVFDPDFELGLTDEKEKRRRLLSMGTPVVRWCWRFVLLLGLEWLLTRLSSMYSGVDLQVVIGIER